MADNRIGERYWLTLKAEAALDGREYDPVKEYKAAVAASIAAGADTIVGARAQALVVELMDEMVTYHYPCTICGAAQEHTVPVHEGATYTEWPRGICGRHG